jgi:hypothetical protein
MAAAYGDHPEAAARRMRWARNVVETLFQTVPAAPARPRGGVPQCAAAATAMDDERPELAMQWALHAVDTVRRMAS